MRLNHNLASLNIYREQSKNIKNQAIVTARISSGYKIYGSKDNPNRLAQSEMQRIQIRGLQIASQNCQDGVSMAQAAESGLNSITDMLQRIRELTIQSGGSASDDDKNQLNDEIKQLLVGINDIAKNTEFNGKKLLINDGENRIDKLYMQIGANVGENVEIPLINISDETLGSLDGNFKLKDIDILAEGGIDKSLDIIDGALDSVNSYRSKYGALENRFNGSYESIIQTRDHIQQAESNLRDADIAEEMVAYARNNILIEAGNAMMVQSNNFPKDILRILENVKK